MNTKILIVGAGISGIYTSILLKQKLNNVDVIVLESNQSALKKLLSTGNGRCNLSNSDMTIDYFNSDNQALVESIINDFDIHELNDLGLYLVQFGNLYYPKSEQALSVKRVLLNIAQSLGVLILTDQHVQYIDYNNQYIIHTANKDYKCDKCILAMGSPASKLSGIDDDRYKMLEKLNLDVIKPEASLCALNTKKVYPFKGVRVKGTVTLLESNKEIHKEKGELLFTDYGISGISVMQLSHHLLDNHQYKVVLDMFDEIDEEDLNQLIHQNFTKGEYYLDGLVNTNIASWLYKHKEVDEVAHLLKNFTFDIQSKRDIEYAQVCKGGLSLKEVDDTLQVKQYPGLYVLGEQLNVNAMCGGYNIHFALSCAKRVAHALIGELC